MVRHGWLVGQVCLVLAVVACGGDEPLSPRIPASIVVVPNEPSIPQKETRQLTATVVDASGREIEGETVEFTSSDSTIVTVSPGGLLTSVGPLGEAVITAHDGELTAAITATVILKPSSIIVTPNPVLVNPTLGTQLTVVVTDANGAQLPFPLISFVTSDPGIVTVDAFGTVMSVGPLGTATITVRSSGLSTDVPVTVAQIPTSLSVNPTSIVLPPGTDQQLTAVVLDAASHPISGAQIGYSSSKPDIFTASGSGLVHSVGPNGSGSVTVTSGNLVASVGVFVGDTPPGTVLATVTTPVPWGVSVTPARKYYVTLPSGGIIGGAFPNFAFPFSAPTNSGAFNSVSVAIAVNAAGTIGYVAAAQSGSDLGIGVVDLVGGNLLEVIPVPFESPLAVALSTDESTLFVGTGAGIRVIDLATKTLVGATDVGPINEITHHPSQPLLYASVNSGAVVEINANTRAITRTFTIPGVVQGNAVSPDGSELYVALENGPLVVWDLVQNQLKRTLDGSGAGGFGLGISPNGQFLYAVGFGSVRIYDRASLTLLRTVDRGGDPRRIGFDPATGTAIVTNAGGWVDFIK